MLRPICARYSAKVVSVSAALWLVLAAAQGAWAAEDPPERILERFEVGRSVFVRSLALSRDGESLWVGTS